MKRRVERLEAASKPIKVTLTILPGPASLAQKAAWSRFWRQIAAEARKEAASD